MQLLSEYGNGYFPGTNIRIPRLGDTIDQAWGIKLCEYFGLTEIAARVKEHPEWFKKSFEFDGCSGLDDHIYAFLARVNEFKLRTYVCLPHDLKFAYGLPGEYLAFRRANEEFVDDLTKIGGSHKVALMFKAVVDEFGKEALDTKWKWAFSWDGPRLCPDNCAYLGPKGEGHLCNRYRDKLQHGIYHPHLIRLERCDWGLFTMEGP